MAWSTAEKIGSQEPTKSFYDDSLRSFFDVPRVKEDLVSFGMELYPWQELVLKTSLSVDGGRLYYMNVGLSVPRQNGKSEILSWRAIIGMLYLNQNILYTSYNKDSARAIYKRMQEIIEGSKELSRYIKIGDQHNKMELRAFNPLDGKPMGSVEFHTRAGGKSRGESYDVIFFDEAQFLTSGQVSSASPTTATFEDAQIWYVGTPEPVDAAVSKGGTSGSIGGVFRRVRRDILKNNKGHSCFFEWGISSMVPKDVSKFWYISNPSLGFKPSGGRGLSERSFVADTLSEEEFAVERLGFWSDQERGAVIDAGTWKELEIDQKTERLFTSPQLHDSMVLAIKTDYEEHFVDVALAFKKGDEVFVRIADSFQMSEPWVDKVMEIVKRMIDYQKCISISIDGITAQQQIVQQLRKIGKWPRKGSYKKFGKVSLVTPNQVRASASNFVSKIVARSIFHGSQPQVDSAIYDAEKRIHGSTWWGFRSISSKTKASLVEVLALAVLSVNEVEEDSIDIAKENESGFIAPEWRTV